jgi:hypothetical protein
MGGRKAMGKGKRSMKISMRVARRLECPRGRYGAGDECCWRPRDVNVVHVKYHVTFPDASLRLLVF